MKSVVLKYGIYSGLISAGLMLVSFVLMKQLGDNKVSFEYSAYIGYTCIFLAMVVIYAAIRHFRDTENGGKVSFLQGLAIGLGITFISCIFYSLMWLVVYYNLMPDFMDQYASYQEDKMLASGEGQEAIDQMKAQMESFKEVYKSPFQIFLFTMIEPAPVGVLVSLVSSLFLKKKA